MNLVAIIGSHRKGKTTDTLIDKAIEGALSADSTICVKKIYLSEHNIDYCHNCLICRDRKTDEPVSKCAIRDDMDIINEDLLASDAMLWGTPLHMSYPTALMLTFLERICWTFAKPEGRILTISGIPTPRSPKRRRSAIIITNAGIPPALRFACDNATSVLKDVSKLSLNAKTVDVLYAGALEKRGVERYFGKAFELGKKLV